MVGNDVEWLSCVKSNLSKQALSQKKCHLIFCEISILSIKDFVLLVFVCIQQILLVSSETLLGTQGLIRQERLS